MFTNLIEAIREEVTGKKKQDPKQPICNINLRVKGWNDPSFDLRSFLEMAERAKILSKFDGKYLFCFPSNVDRDARPDGSLELREKDYVFLQSILPAPLLENFKSGEEKIFYFEGPMGQDVFNLRTLRILSEGKAALLQRTSDNVDIC